MGVEFNVFIVKEANHKMITISTYCGIMVCEGQNEEYKMSKGEVYMFQYAEPFSRHYLYRGAVDNHNDMYHDGGTKY